MKKVIPNEEWRDIPGYEGLYQVSSIGRVKSLPRETLTKDGWYQRVKGGLMRQQLCSNGYGFYPLSKDGKVKLSLTHRLVLEAFVGESDLEVNHKDGDKTNNCLENLEYVTRRENQLHSFRVLKREPVRSWLGKRGAEHNKSYGVRVIDTITGDVKEFGSYRIADENGFCRTTIGKYINTDKVLHHCYKFESV